MRNLHTVRLDIVRQGGICMTPELVVSQPYLVDRCWETELQNLIFSSRVSPRTTAVSSLSLAN